MQLKPKQSLGFFIVNTLQHVQEKLRMKIFTQSCFMQTI